MDRLEPLIIDIKPAPDNSDVLLVYVPVPVMLVRDDPVVGTAYSAWALPGKLLVKAALQSHIYTRKVPAPEGYCGFSFLQAKTAEEMKVPFKTTPTFEDSFPWDDVVKWLEVDYDPLMPDSAVVLDDQDGQGFSTAPSPIIRSASFEGPRGAQIITREFFAPAKFDIPEHEQPQPTAIVLDLRTKQFHSARCLHPLIEIPARPGSTGQVFGDKMAGGVSFYAGQRFPATNFPTLRKHIFSDTQHELETGGWHRIQKEAIAPPEPKLNLREED